MPDPLRKVRTGESLNIPAATWNAFVDTARKLRAAEHDLDSLLARSLPSFAAIKVKNTSAADRARFSVLGLDAPIITPTASLDGFKQRPQIKGVVPTDADHTGKFCILYEPLRNNITGWGLVSGPALVQIDVVHASHRFADVKNSDSTKLKSSHCGSAEILWKESGTGTKWALVRLGPYSPGQVLAKLEADWSKASSKTAIKVFIGTPGSEVDSTLTITGYNRFANLTASAGSPKWIWLGWNGFGFYVTAAEC